MHDLRLWIFIVVSSIGLINPVYAEGRIVKWVDEKGVTHYGDSIPPQYSGRNSSEINRQGRVTKHNKAGNIQPNVTVTEPENKVNLEQERRDRALLAAYTTEQEFDLARDRNLQTDEAAIQGLQQRKSNTNARLETNKKMADTFSQRKQPVPADVAQDIKKNQSEIAKIDAQIVERKQSMEATRQRFAHDKQRFIELKRDPKAPPSAASAPAVTGVEPKPSVPESITKPAQSGKPVAAP